jgi:hypothetical protein
MARKCQSDIFGGVHVQCGDDFLRDLFYYLSSAVDCEIGLAVRGQTLRIERTERVGIGGQRARILHRTLIGGAATLQEFPDIEFKEDDASAMPAQQFSILRLNKRSATQRNDGGSGSALEHSAQTRGLDMAEARFTLGRKNLANRLPSEGFDFAIEIDEAPAKVRSEHSPHGALADGHEAGEGDDGRGRELLVRLRERVHTGRRSCRKILKWVLVFAQKSYHCKRTQMR